MNCELRITPLKSHNLTIRRSFVRKHSLLIIFLLFALLLAACNGNGGVEEAEPTPRPTPTTGETAPPTPEEGYPAQPTDPPVSGYPVEEVGAEGWVVRPAGEQCAESLAYPSAESATADLEAAGITILAVEETELLVCEACGCPTSAHYRVLVSAEDLPTALSLGWQHEPQSQ